jgi:hypothetical protein
MRGKRNNDTRRQAEIKAATNVDVKFNCDTEGQREALRNSDRACRRRDNDGSDIAEAEPDCKIGAGANVKTNDVKLSRESELGAQPQPDVDGNGGGQIDLGADGNGHRRDTQVVKAAVHNLEGQGRDFDIAALREDNLEAGRHVYGGGDAEHQVEGQGGADVELDQAGHADG